MTFTHRQFNTTRQQIRAMNDVKAIIASANLSNAFAFSKSYAAWETDEVQSSVLCTVQSRFNEARFNVKSRFKERNLVTKIKFHIEKSRISVTFRFKESKRAVGGHSLNRVFTVQVF